MYSSVHKHRNDSRLREVGQVGARGRRPFIDLEAAGGVDLARLERSLLLEARPVGRGRYLVWGGREPHWVDLYTRRIPRCDCGDHLWRERVCKHILAAMLREGDERVIDALGRLIVHMRGERRAGRDRGAEGSRQTQIA